MQNHQIIHTELTRYPHPLLNHSSMQMRILVEQNTRTALKTQRHLEQVLRKKTGLTPIFEVERYPKQNRVVFRALLRECSPEKEAELSQILEDLVQK